MNPRIGELLGRIIPLSDHDVEEILNEQQSSGNKQFGDIALQLGKARPEHILEAWLHQLDTRTDHRISLARAGVDAQAVACVSPEMARTHRVVPIRAIADQLLVAAAAPLEESLIAELEHCAGRRVKCVLADAAEIDAAVARYYDDATDHLAA